MTLGIGHFAFGFGTSILVLTATGIHWEISRDLLVGVGGGLFALIPDLSKFTDYLMWMHDSSISNIFFLHHLLDTPGARDLEPGLSLVLVFYMCACIGALLYKEYKFFIIDP